MDAALERRVLQAFDEALACDEDAREARLAALDPALAARVRALIAAEDEAALALPTAPPEPAESVEALPPPERVGVYRVAALLGEGGMGTVWRGERDDGLFAQAVAIKLVRPGQAAASAMAQFHAERRLLARLRHPNIAQLFDGGTDPEGRAYFIMELVEGTPLTDFARARNLAPSCLGAKGLVPLVEAVCAAVQHAHNGLVVHADIKPSNILVDREGRPKLLDFGIARGLDAADEAVAGYGLTLAYASPQRLGGAPPGLADDVYALGAVLHELAQGAPPDTAPPRPLGPGVPAEFAAIVTKATAADPDSRYESAAALARDLRRWADGFPVLALPPTLARSARLLVRRRPWTTAAASTAAAGLVVAFAVILTLYLRAEAERREADARFAQARGMAHYMLFDVFDRLTDTPGTLPVRRALADRARRYLDELSAAPRAPASVRAEAAIGLMQVAGVEGLFSAGQLGDRAHAEQALAQSERLLPISGPDADDPHLVYARGRLKLFQGLHAYDRGGAAAPLLREAIAGLGRARGLLPDDVEPAADLWQARLFLADALGGEGAHREALALIAEAVQDYARDGAALRGFETTPLLLARSFKLVGRTKVAVGSAAAAEADFLEAERLLVAEDAAHPRRSRTLMELLDVRWDLAGSRLEQGRAEEARATVEAALDLARARLAVEPDHDGLQRMVSLLDAQHAEVLRALGRNAEARDAALASLAARARRRVARPEDGVAWREYLSALRVAGDAESAAGGTAAACGHFREARRGYDTYLVRFPDARAVVLAQTLTLDDRLAAC